MFLLVPGISNGNAEEMSTSNNEPDVFLPEDAEHLPNHGWDVQNISLMDHAHVREYSLL